MVRWKSLPLIQGTQNKCLGGGPYTSIGRLREGIRIPVQGLARWLSKENTLLASTHLELEFQGTQHLLLASNGSCLHVVCISSWRYIPIINQPEEQFQFILGYIVDPVLSKRKDKESKHLVPLKCGRRDSSLVLRQVLSSTS